MIVRKEKWETCGGLWSHEVDIIITSGNKQILFSNPYVGTLALATRTKADLKKGSVTYKIEYGNSATIGSSMPNETILRKVKCWIMREYFSEYINEINFEEVGDITLGHKKVEITIK